MVDFGVPVYEIDMKKHVDRMERTLTVQDLSPPSYVQTFEVRRVRREEGGC